MASSGDPYRTGGGTPCPRCKRPLLLDEGEQRCTDGCGTWLPNAIVATLLEVETLPKVSRGNPFRATALPPTKCLVCRTPLNDLYQGAVDTLVVGQCVEHGVWIERADRDTFESMYAPAITWAKKERRRLEKEERERQLEAAAAAAQRAAELHADPVIVDLVRRIVALEARVADLERGKD